jgi:hypothetical protein
MDMQKEMRVLQVANLFQPFRLTIATLVEKWMDR